MNGPLVLLLMSLFAQGPKGIPRVCWPAISEELSSALTDLQSRCQSRPDGGGGADIEAIACERLLQKRRGPARIRVFVSSFDPGGPSAEGSRGFTLRFFWVEGDIVQEVDGYWDGERCTGVARGILRPGPLFQERLLDQGEPAVFDYAAGLKERGVTTTITEALRSDGAGR